jgi:lipopolysaccharide/colanic/teichoic acid biosynthesis glycosyltransferase
MYHKIKPLSDFVIAALLLLLTSPLMLLLMLIMSVQLRGNSLYIQPRVGKNGKYFHLFKFKTVIETYDTQNKLLSEEYRLTPLGRFLRDTSLDELPQLLNVVRGDMSLIGPRPLIRDDLARCNAEQLKRRHIVRPGITGWAQVNGRNSISLDNKLTLDLWYVDHVSFLLDLKILLMTVYKVITREGI